MRSFRLQSHLISVQYPPSTHDSFLTATSLPQSASSYPLSAPPAETAPLPPRPVHHSGSMSTVQRKQRDLKKKRNHRKVKRSGHSRHESPLLDDSISSMSSSSSSSSSSSNSSLPSSSSSFFTPPTRFDNASPHLFSLPHITTDLLLSSPAQFTPPAQYDYLKPFPHLGTDSSRNILPSIVHISTAPPT